jgi:hypothetical protein
VASCLTHREISASVTFAFSAHVLTWLSWSTSSFPVPDIERTLDAMSWVHVRISWALNTKKHCV